MTTHTPLVVAHLGYSSMMSELRMVFSCSCRKMSLLEERIVLGEEEEPVPSETVAAAVGVVASGLASENLSGEVAVTKGWYAEWVWLS